MKYMFEMLVRGSIEADSPEEALEAMAHISINSDAGDYDIFVDETCDIHLGASRALPSPEEWWAAYHTEGCTCRQVPVEDRIFIGGQDDCSVHGFGEEVR